MGRTEGWTARAPAEEGNRPTDGPVGEEKGPATATDREDTPRTNRRAQRTVQKHGRGSGSLAYLLNLFPVQVLLLIQTGRIDELKAVSQTQFAQWKEEVGEVENSLSPTLRTQFRSELADLERKALALDGKIHRAFAYSQKMRKHGEKLTAKLSTFELWLVSAEKDVNAIEDIQVPLSLIIFTYYHFPGP